MGWYWYNILIDSGMPRMLSQVRCLDGIIVCITSGQIQPESQKSIDFIFLSNCIRLIDHGIIMIVPPATST